MLAIPSSVRIFLAAGATDMRKSFDTLAQATKGVIGEDPLSGHLFVFCNRSRNRLKVLWWDRSGYCLLAKRLEKGTFIWPQQKDGFSSKVEMLPDELSLLLGGLDIRFSSRRHWYKRPG
ncbi:MAG: transposase [Planctomycetota bacterium]|nr:MAG: transposase [Planctomycetota bacterium]